MKALEKNKGMMIALFLFCIAIIAYNFLSKNSAVDESLGLTAQSIGNDVVTLNDQLNRVDLSTTLFSTPAYRSLSDFAPALPVETAGRNNPFAPIGQ